MGPSSRLLPILCLIATLLSLGCISIQREKAADAFAEEAQQYEINGENQKAIESLEKALDIRPADSPHQWIDLYILGGLLMKEEEHTRAVSAYEKMLRHDDQQHHPKKAHLQTLLCIASAYAMMGDVENTVGFLQQASGVSSEAMYITSQVPFFDSVRETEGYRALHELHYERGKSMSGGP